MIKEFAFSLSNRHHFQAAEKASDWLGLDKDTFTSLYDYDEYVVEFFSKNKTLSGFDGMIYMPDEFILDVDGPETTKAKDRTIGLLILLKDLDVPYNLYFSGRGFHVGIPSTAFRWKPDKDLHLKVKDALINAGIFEYADPSVTDKTRLIRLVNTKNLKSGFWKVQITEDYLHKDLENLFKYASFSRKLIDNVLECDPVFDVLIRKKEKQQEIIQHNLGMKPDPVNHTCIQRMLDGAAYGKRHMIALRIAAHLRWRYPESVVRIIMEDWRMRVSTEDNVFSKSEMDSIIDNCYNGHGGQGYRYGCNDPVMDSYCSTTCKLYKTKKSQNVMDAESMEAELISFYTNKVEPLNLGALYGQDFPIYPGEVLILQAPPASMKTMLLQNWMNAFKKTTYFLEMEMSPRQIWSRFVMIENDWNEEELTNHYKQLRNGMDEKFKWLTVDYSAPYATELEKRITMLPQKPELVVIDHMGLFKSKQRDNNMKVEEVSQSLMEIAIKYNVVVFAVSEITKQAFHEGMNMASSRGSFRIAYNANKLLSVTPYKNTETGLIEMLQIKCDKNREREYLNVQLNVNNVRIGI